MCIVCPIAEDCSHDVPPSQRHMGRLVQLSLSSLSLESLYDPCVCLGLSCQCGYRDLYEESTRTIRPTPTFSHSRFKSFPLFFSLFSFFPLALSLVSLQWMPKITPRLPNSQVCISFYSQVLIFILFFFFLDGVLVFDF